MQIDVSKFVPWELTLVIGGKPIATRPPTLAGLELVGKVQAQIDALGAQANIGQALAAVVPTMRAALGSMIATEMSTTLSAAPWDDLLGAFTAAQAYFGRWLSVKQAALIAAAGDQGKPAAQAKAPVSSRSASA